MQPFKDNANEAEFIPLEINNNINRIAMIKVLYEPVVILRRKDLIFTGANKNKNEAKFKFQGQSARSQRCFDLDLDWIQVNFSTHEPDFYKIFFKSMTIHKIQIHLNYLNFQQETQNVWKMLRFTMMPQSTSIVRSH